MKIIIKNLEKEEIQAIKAMINLHSENVTLEVSNYAGEVRFNGLELETEE